MRRNRLAVAPPQPDLMAGQRKIAGRRERAISTTQHGNAHEGALLIILAVILAAI